MANSERISINLNKERAQKIRSLVRNGVYPSVSSAFDAAAGVLLAQEAEREAWWQETLRRCDEAEKNPEMLLAPDAFFQGVRQTITRTRTPAAKAR